MKKQFKIVSFFVIALFCLAFSFICFGSHKPDDKYEDPYAFKQEKRTTSNVNEMIEKVKAPAYYTVFNVILNYLPLNN